MKIALITMVVALAGCAAMQLGPQYGRAQGEKFVVDEKAFQIFSHPTERHRYWVQDSYGAAIGKGIVKGLTLGIVDTTGLETTYEDALIKWLAATGETCEVRKSQVVADAGYEIWTSCRPKS